MGNVFVYIAIAVAGLLLFNLISLAVLAIVSQRRPRIARPAGRLRPCPATPNCVCSQDAEAKHAIEPLGFTGSAEEAVAHLKSVLGRMPRTRLVADQGDYLHYEVASRIMRFVDDVEFLVDARAKAIHVRSASRVGYSDLGVNRKRMERIRTTFDDRR